MFCIWYMVVILEWNGMNDELYDIEWDHCLTSGSLVVLIQLPLHIHARPDYFKAYRPHHTTPLPTPPTEQHLIPKVAQVLLPSFPEKDHFLIQSLSFLTIGNSFQAPLRNCKSASALRVYAKRSEPAYFTRAEMPCISAETFVTVNARKVPQAP